MRTARIGIIFASALALSVIAAASFASAHEVYLLSAEEIAAAKDMARMPARVTLEENLSQFVFWAFVALVVLTTVYFMSLSRRIVNMCGPFLRRVKKYAPIVVRVGTGLAFLSFAYYGGLFGPELPLSGVYGSAAPVAGIAFALGGLALIANVLARSVSLLLLAVAGAGALMSGFYSFTYVEYAGALLFLAIGDGAAPARAGAARPLARVLRTLAQYRWAILRMGLGASIMFAAVYAKVVHSALAYMVVEKYDLTSYWLFAPFEPHFLVLGAAIIEFLAGILIFLGIEIRHTAAFVAFWLTLSMVFFREAVWPHIILFTLAGACMLYGYDRFSVFGRLYIRDGKEPVL
ncbi:hypothetical protein COU20_01265 [Candidatus Kaiserbacteria bacterium CG10_big_fil_rev_8_21_14_0_10_59_10]|uniref:DoxX family protein n=1 Tax=Candidatus Kaiserbacteria bacterium CG10_big_fil_rev_8_21_14_0_10_59_10 TaxID=1974612 RepID=A0A2H0U8B9_9BACT|nr:MAG: hypothetical protein COU20_01265 [Candidatus Kaiserbacteria bacterium CG10_big_fil_rev_8_21_14_0_10_59_10]